MTRTVTRRQLAAAVAALPAARLRAQAVPAGDELLQQARDLVRRNAAELAKRPIPMATEPAFVFKV
jgi:hypothetical protein